MRLHSLILFILSAFLLFSCAEDAPAPQVLKSSERTLHFSGNGGVWMLTINSNTSWQIEGTTEWCSVDRPNGANTTNLTVQVKENTTSSPRATNLQIISDRQTIEVLVEQDTLSGTFHYELPVVFHIIYSDPTDSTQYVKKEVINEMIEKCNEIYQNSNGSIDMNLHLKAALQNPDGEELAEPGIHRVLRTNSAYKNSESFLLPTNTTDGDLMWDPNQYVNVFVFTFVEPNVAGRTTLPHTPRQNSLEGLIANNTYYTQVPNFPWGITLNNTFIYEESNYTTLAHELGHYLGLYHVFTTSTDSTDYCDDTYSYNRTDYENHLAQNPELTMQEKYQRKTADGTVFTSYNVMDYYYTYSNQFTADQFLRIRHVLEHSPLIPGPKNISVSRSLIEETEPPQVITR